jgi:hypothetical protein
MIIIAAYKCSVCGHVDQDRQTLINHENACINKEKYEHEKNVKQKHAHEYLDTIRHRSNSVSELFYIIENEMNNIKQAVSIIAYYNEEIELSSIVDITYNSYAFANEKNTKIKKHTHCEPVELNKDKQSNAFELEVIYNFNNDGKNVDFLKYIPGFNTGSCGTWKGSRHLYTTFWKHDFPIKFCN